jgi:hypothetical protein
MLKLRVGGQPVAWSEPATSVESRPLGRDLVLGRVGRLAPPLRLCLGGCARSDQLTKLAARAKEAEDHAAAAQAKAKSDLEQDLSSQSHLQSSLMGRPTRTELG